MDAWGLGAQRLRGGRGAGHFPRARYVGIAAYNGAGTRAAGSRARRAFFTSVLGNAPVNGQASCERAVGNLRATAEATGGATGST